MRSTMLGTIAVAAIAGTVTAGNHTGCAATDTCVPDALANADELHHRAVAELVYPALPVTHQHAIRAAGGHGYKETTVGVGVLAPVEEASLPENASVYVAERLTPTVRERLGDDLAHILETLAERLDAGELIPAMCLSPDADPVANEILDTINRLFTTTDRFQQTSRWSNTATDGGGLNQGDPITLTYSYVPDGTFVPNLIGVTGNSNLFTWLNGIYGSPANWQPIFDQVFARWSDLIAIDYVYEPNDDGSNLNGASGQIGVRGDVRIAAIRIDGNSNTLAYNNFPNDGDMVLDSADNFYNSTGSNSLRLRNIIAHEHGHGIGLLHVCPINGTILMEPFINLGFDGPQLDDILSGQRHYGDPLENNDNAGEATPIGPITSTGADIAGFVDNVSIDDNSDIDFFAFEVTSPVRISFSASPDADEYVQGTQTQNCNTGTLTDYNSVHNLSLTIFSTNGITPITSANNTGLGQTEDLTVDLYIPGTYYVAVTGSSTNSIQRYSLSWLGSVPPSQDLTLGEITGIPAIIDPNTPTDFTIFIAENDDELLGTPQLSYRFGTGSFTQTPLTLVSGSLWSGTLPGGPCGETAELFVTAESTNLGTSTSDTVTAGIFEIATVFEDNFESNTGWTVAGSISGASSGEWDRATPNGSGQRGEPATDFDGSGMCFLTGPGTPGENTDVDGGPTILVSPFFDLSEDPEAIISYARWFSNTQGDSPAQDIMTVEVSANGSSWTTVETVGPNDGQNDGGWIEASFRVADFVTPSSTVFVRFVVEDSNPGSVVEAAVDAVRIDSATCPPVPECQADLSGDGNLNNTDINLFVNAFLANQPAADFNGDGNWNNTDINAFVQAFLAGCGG